MTKNKISVFPVLLSRQGDDHLMADGSALPMGCLTSYIKHHKDGMLKNSFYIHPLVNRKKIDWGFYTDQATSHADVPSVWLFSCYVWNVEDNLKIAEEIKARAPGALIVVGGPHVPGYAGDCEKFLNRYPFVDIAVRAEGEKTLAEILETIALKGDSVYCDYMHVAGLTFRDNGKLIRTADRVRSNNLDEYPSPYLTGEFDDASFNNMIGMILETNRGCPYGCTYCDWGAATLQKVRHFDLERVKKEIDYIGSKSPHRLHLADANFGAFERDVEIAKAIVATSKKCGFPKKFYCSNAKNASPIVGRVIKIITEGGLVTQGVISLQTVDDDVLKAVNRSNIKNSSFEKLLDMFKNENLMLASELLIGLPGQTYQSHKRDLQYIVDRKLGAAAYHVQVMPNAPMNEPSYMEKHKIKINKEGFVISTSTFSEEDLKSMSELFLAFQFFYLIGVLKYFLYYLQVEHSIKVMDFIDALLKVPERSPEIYPISYRVRNDLLKKLDPRYVGIFKLQWKTNESEFVFNNLDSYLDEIFTLAKKEFGVKMEATEIETLKAAQMGIMPALGKSVPLTLELPHDLVTYLQQIKEMRVVVGDKPAAFRPLKTFLPGKLKITALRSKVIDNLTFVMSDTTTGKGWELRSPMQFVKPRTQKRAAH